MNNFFPLDFEDSRRRFRERLAVRSDFFDTPNPESLAFCERFIPRVPVTSLTSPTCQTLETRDGQIFFADVPMDDFIKATGLGQFETAAGLEFGGRSLEPQIEQLITLLQKLMPLYQDIILLDLHTA